MQNWIKTSEQDPPIGKVVLGDDGTGIYLVTYLGDNYWQYEVYKSQYGPEYWSILPEVND